MHHLLVWPLSQQSKIIFVSNTADLSTITCCDTINIILQHNDQQIMILESVTGCALTSFKILLHGLIFDQQQSARFQDVFLFQVDQFDNWLIDIRLQHKPLLYALVTVDTLKSWQTQLDLLQVVMEENENEKKSRGSGCCG